MEATTLGGGCFWCIEAVFQQIKGVDSVISGYAGGITDNPSYEEVCSGQTGHAEVVQIQFDPQFISYRELLEVFFEIHDPTSLNRQGNDIGTHYRSIILFHSEEQKSVAEQLKDESNSGCKFRNKIVTEIVPFTKFYPAEEYHQNFYQQNPNYGYCQFIINPKLEKFQKQFYSLISC